MRMRKSVCHAFLILLTILFFALAALGQENQPPTADAGADQSVSEDETVMLDGSASSDPDDGIAGFSWLQLDGPQVTLSDATAVQPTFDPDVGIDGETYVFQLTVTDLNGAKSTDETTVNVAWVNEPPNADAGVDQVAAAGIEVTLDGSGSSDPDDGIASYSWSQIGTPAIALSDSSAIRPTFTVPENTGGVDLTFELTVTDNGGLTDQDKVVVEITIINQEPIADAGVDRTVAEGAAVTLDGSGSSDPDDGIASYSWLQTGGAQVSLSDAGVVQPTFTAPEAGASNIMMLTFQLTVTDNSGKTDADSVTITVSGENTPPTADAGEDFTVAEGAEVTLDAAASSDPDDGIAAYLWEQTGGTEVELSDGTADRPTFTAPEVAADGAVLTFQLTVTDTAGQTAVDEVTVTVEWVPGRPVADAGPDQTVGESVEVTLNGSNSADPDGDITGYQWLQTGGTSVELSDPAAPQPVFTSPEVGPDGQSLVFTLTVTDSAELTHTDETIVNVSWNNTAPVANAGPDQDVQENVLVYLNGTNSSDPDDGIAYYRWTQTAGPVVALSDAETAVAGFTSPDVSDSGASLTFVLRVTDNGGLQSSDDAIVNVSWLNRPPETDAGADQTSAEGDVVTLDGSNSFDTDDGISSYQWLQTGGTQVTLADPAAVKTTFTAPDVGTGGVTLRFQLTVTDNGGLQAADQTLVNISWDNKPPVAEAGADQVAYEGVRVTLDGSGSYDLDDGIEGYRWAQLSGIPVQLSDPPAAQAVFLTPDVGPEGESLVFRLTVTDAGGLQGTDKTTINVSWVNAPPTAAAGGDQEVSEGETVQLNGTGSTDPDGDILTYRWEQSAGPLVTLSNPAAAAPFFVPHPVRNGVVEYGFSLTVTDLKGLAGTDSITVAVSDNGMGGFSEDLLTFRAATGDSMAIRADGGALIRLSANSANSAKNSANRPLDIPYGLIETEIRLRNGGTATTAFALPGPAPEGYEWFLYDGDNGWRKYPHTVFNANRDEVVLTFVDGGAGDGDGEADGTITAKTGLGLPDVDEGDGGDDDDDTVCFIRVLSASP